jgi:hypothetical protein
MSANIRGITFAEQTVTPTDDAIVRRAMLSDGILSGCSITYSGSTLTLAAGYMIACGRIFQITAARNWAVVDATSGVARLVLTIDLTKTATESAFDQISFGIDYATAENGFVNLTQDDINIAGVRYQVAVAVVSLGAGGITGIISKLEKAEGGGGLNFKVVAGLTQPGSATENTIWVMTEKIGGYYFSATQPDSMQELDVWICTGQFSSVAFNALRKNAIQIYPISAKQMVGGVLVDVTAKSYLGGAWADWWNGELYDAGNEFSDVTGGWIGTPKGLSADANDAGTPIITRGSTSLTMQMPGPTGAMIHTAKKIDLSDYATLVFDGKVTGATDYSSLCSFYVWSDIGAYSPSNAVAREIIQRNVDGEIALDIAGLSGMYYIGFGLWTSSPVVDMRSMRLKRSESQQYDQYLADLQTAYQEGVNSV